MTNGILDGRNCLPVPAEQPFKFQCMGCPNGVQHYKVLNPHSVDTEVNLACRACLSLQAIYSMAADLNLKEPAGPSDGEEGLLNDIVAHGVQK